MPRQTQKQKDAALIEKVMDVADVSQQIVADRLGKSQSGVSWCVTGRSHLSKLERIELKRWLAELEAERKVFGRVVLVRHEVPTQPLAFFEHMKECADCLQKAYEAR
jgi:hypothetical protein